MATLVLLRHAKAEPENGLGDAQRPLSSRGRRQATALGPLLATHVGGVDVALVSEALRTTETYKLLAASWSEGAPEADVRKELYSAGPRDVIALLAELPPEAERVLVVGHEPTMSSTAALLAGDGESAHLGQVRTGLPTGSFAVLELPAWSRLDAGTGRLLDVVRPAH